MDKKVIHHYFIDEAGDTALFGSYQKPIKLGVGGTSKFFMIGAVRLENPEYAARKLDDLRQDLIADPYFRAVPSFKKSAIYFHAKDDFHTIKREVFNLIASLDVEAHVVVRQKTVLINQAKLLFKETGRKLSEAAIYNDLLKRLLPGFIHKADENHIWFAERGRTFTNHSLDLAVKKARDEYLRAYGIEVHDNNFIYQGYPRNNAGLQIADYLLWAIQRLFEREEDYYFSKLRHKYSLVVDVDNTINSGDGERYEGSNMPTISAVHEPMYFS